jgi:thiol-disulfide isomerase/thioredoxin
MTVKKVITLFLLPLTAFMYTACGNNTEKSSSSDKTDSPKTSLSQQKIDAIEAAVFFDFDGNEISISEFRGKTVLIDFWETWCAPCLASMPTLDRLMNEYSEDFVVLATSPLWSDSKEDVLRFKNNHDYTFYYVHANELANKLEIRGIPYKVYVAPDGSFYKDEAGSRGPERDFQMISEVIENLRSN